MSLTCQAFARYAKRMAAVEGLCGEGPAGLLGGPLVFRQKFTAALSATPPNST